MMPNQSSLAPLSSRPRYLTFKAFDSHELASAEEKAYEFAMRLYEAIDKMAQSDDSAAGLQPVLMLQRPWTV